jgi:hypothetical protein
VASYIFKVKKKRKKKRARREIGKLEMGLKVDEHNLTIF